MSSADSSSTGIPGSSNVPGPPSAPDAVPADAGRADAVPSAGEGRVPHLLAGSVQEARSAAQETAGGGVGEHVCTVGEDASSATHYFTADIRGYRGWQWAVVVAAPPGAEVPTVSEVALLPGPEALVAPEWKPWEQRVRPGDLGPGDLLPPPEGDPRLVPGYVANGDPEVDEVALEVGLGREQVLSQEGRADAAQRWHDGEHGPGSGMAKAAPGTCGTCGFFLPLAGALHGEFGVCANEFAADGTVVHARYGCGAHSDTSLPKGAGSPAYDPFDDGVVETVSIPTAPAAATEAPAGEAGASAGASTSVPTSGE